MAYVYQIVVLDPRTTLLIKCRAIYMATLTGSRNMHHWTFTLNLNFATGMWKQTFHDDLECHKLMFEKISVQHVLSTHALMSKGPDQGRLKKGLGFSKWRVCLKNCSFWEAMHLMSQHVSASEILFSLLCYTWAPMYSNAYEIYIYIYVCVASSLGTSSRNLFCHILGCKGISNGAFEFNINKP